MVGTQHGAGTVPGARVGLWLLLGLDCGRGYGWGWAWASVGSGVDAGVGLR